MPPFREGRHTNHLYAVTADERHVINRDFLQVLGRGHTKALARRPDL